MSVDWLNFRWWQDSTGRAWIWHDCAGIERIEPLPTSTWTVVDGRVTPSIDCRACGKHTFVGPADRCEPPPRWTEVVGGGECVADGDG